MALIANKAAIACIAQSVVGTFVDPSANLMSVSNLNYNIQAVTVANPEYTGIVDMPSDEVIGKFIEVSFDINLRGPGGADVPTAGAYLPGMFLNAAKMAESRTIAAIPAAPEALTAGTTTGFTAGAGAAATADIYKGMLVELPTPLGAVKPKSFTPIRSYTAAKAATIMETLGSAATGNYQIPKQLAYHGTLSSVDPLPFSLKAYYDGVCLDLIDMTLTNLQLVIQTSGRESGSIPLMRVSLKGRINAKNDVTTPSIPSLGTTPKFRDGKFFLNGKAIGGASFTATRAMEVASAPNPNQPDGSDADQLLSLKTSVEMEIQAYRKAVFDTLALADGQAYVPFFAMWGNASGQTVCINCPDARIKHAAPQLGQQFVTENTELLVDVFNRSLSIVFPYW